MKHVIIGTGPAGVIAAETLRKLDNEADVLLIGDEPDGPYSRMALPYYLAGRIDERGTYLRKQENHYRDAGIEIVNDSVTAVDAADKQLRLASGSPISYDKLLVATGSRPMTPPIAGMNLPQVHPCWTLQDAREIAALAQPGSKVVLMGAGFIGCIILESLARRRVELSVIEMGDRMVARMMDQTAGEMIKQWCKTRGVAVRTSTEVAAVNRASGDHALDVQLDNSEILPADLVITATGVQPNTEFLNGASIDTEFGILIDRHMQTNQPDIYAAGDVAQGRDFSTGEYSVQAIQPTAADHGQLAARNMSGLNAVHRGSVNMNVLDTMGLISSSFGLWMGVDGGQTAELRNTARYQYLKLQFQDDVVVGAQSLGLTEHVGVLRGLIQTKIRLGKWKDKLMREPNLIMEAYLANTQALGHDAYLISNL